ncbi:LacI family transcriptional regulator [Spirochaetia bacterium]|nr:LacI family transcriptional regulator [Spirochaetia bacterium]
MPVGIRDIADAAGVSVSTVSNVMNNRPNVGGATRTLVQDLCKKMNYIPNAAGKSLKSRESKTILFNFSDFDRSFYLKIIEGINDYAGDNGYDLMICTTKSCEKYMHNSLTDGCIILDSRMQNETLLRTAREQYPIVALDRTLPNPYIKSLVVNNYSPMIEMMEEIMTRGYRKYAFIGGPEHTDDTKERFQAFMEVLDKNNVPFRRENYFSGDYRDHSGYQAVNILLLAGDLPEILVCANDNMAIGAMKALRERGYRVPEDVAVTGFDNCEQAEMLGLTTVAVPNYERGYLAARSLIENINGKKDFEPLKISAPVKWRNTVAPAV